MREKGFWAQLFDFSFSSYVTLKVVKFLYGLWIAVGTVGAYGMCEGGLSLGSYGLWWSAGGSVPALIYAVAFFFVWTVIGRVWLETIVVLFRIAENSSVLVKQKERQDGQQ